MKVIYDTCLYVDLLRESSRLPLFADRKVVRYLSPVVMMELLAGVRTVRQRRSVERLIGVYSGSNRIIPLNAQIYYKAGECLARLPDLSPGSGLSHDVLIALSALSIGAVLFTGNKKDFTRIAKLIPVLVEYV